MQVSIETISDVKRRLRITVPVGQVEAAYEQQLNETAKKASIKGFRPGKVPISYIRQRFGTAAHQEAVNTVIKDALFKAISEHQLQPIAMPQVEPKVAVLNQPLEFIAVVEELPKIGDVKLQADNIEKIQTVITDADIDHVVEQLRKQQATWTAVPQPAAEKDRVVIDYHIVDDEKTENKVSDYTVELGSGTLIPGFEAGLIGAKAGEDRTLALTFPENYHNKEKANQSVTFAVHVKQVLQGEYPALDDAFIKQVGIESGAEADLRQQIKQTLEQERDRLVKENLKSQVFDLLLAQNPLEVPPSLVAQEAKNIHDEIYKHKHHDHASHNQQELLAFNELAKKRVMLSLLLAEYAKQHDIKTDSARVEARISEIAAVYEDPQEIITWLKNNAERRSGIESQVLEEQVLDALVASLPVTEKVLTYTELKGK